MIDNQIFQRQRARMVDKQIHWRGIQSEIVLSAMQKVPRHEGGQGRVDNHEPPFRARLEAVGCARLH